MQIYILDTNVIIDYVDIIPGDTENNLEEPTIDLSSAHIVIPTAVVRELSNFKKEHSDRGKVARIALKRIRELFKDVHAEMEDFYMLNEVATVQHKNQVFSILPIPRYFTDLTLFRPASDDMDGQIILAALSAAKGINMNGHIVKQKGKKQQVTLLTNDNGLAIRAIARGIKTSHFSCKCPAPYNGRRDVLVPDELFKEFWNSKEGIPLEEWKKWMPKEPKLMANEFIIMRVENYPSGFSLDNNSRYYHIARYDANEKSLKHLKFASNFPIYLKNPGQVIYAEALMDPNISAVICTGPAGTGKTYLATCYSLDACKKGEYIGVAVVPCQIQDNIGYLPGDVKEKMSLYVQPIKDAIRNYLLQNDKDFKKRLETLRKYGCNYLKTGEKDSNLQSQKSLKRQLDDVTDLTYDNWFGEPIPVDHARGRDFPYQIAYYEEFQDQNPCQADTLLKRIGEGGKIIITGDIEQVHSAYLDRENNGIVYASRLLEDDPMVARIAFTEDEVVRHPLVKVIAKRQKGLS